MSETAVYLVVEWVQVEASRAARALGGEPKPKGAYLSLQDAQDSIPRKLRTEDWGPVPESDSYTAFPYEIWPTKLIA